MKKNIRDQITKCLLVLSATLSGYGSANAQSWQNVGESFPASTAFSISLATNNDTVYMAYADSTNGYKATVVKYVDSNWVTVGSAGFTPGAAYFMSLVMDNNGVPYLAYADYANGEKATVMRYNSSTNNWVSYGTADFSSGRAYYITFAFDHNNTPYVAYEDNNYTNRATVMKYTGGIWVPVGTVGFSAGSVYSISIAIDHDNSVYVAYEDNVNTNVGQVMKFNGTTWASIGANFTTNGADFPTILFDSTNTLYVAYTNDSGSIYKATVAKYSGGSWATVGNPNFSTDMAEYIYFAFDSSNTPYVSYTGYDFFTTDSLLSPTVMKYNGSVWAPVGSGSLPVGTGFSAYSPVYSSFAIAKSGELYFAYQNTTDSDKIMVYSYKDSTAVDTTVDTTVTLIPQIATPGLSVTTFPDPATSEVNITYNAYSVANTSLYITNIAGQTVITQDLGKQQTGTVTVPVSQLPAGIYMLQFTSGTEMVRQKIVISR